MPKIAQVGIDFLDTASRTISTEVDIGAHVDDVWAVLLDNQSWLRWFDGGKAMTSSPAHWEHPGDTRTISVGPLKIAEVAVELTPSKRWAMCFTSSNLPLASRMLEVVDLVDTSRNGETRCQLTWTGAADPLLLTKPIWPMIESRLVGIWSASFENLHGYLSDAQ